MNWHSFSAYAHTHTHTRRDKTRDDSLRSSESEKRNLTCHAPKIEKEAEHLIKNGHCYMIILPTGNSEPV